MVDARFRKPLDEELLIEQARRAGGVVTIEENVLEGGFGQAVRACLDNAGVRVPLASLGVDDAFVPHGDQRGLRASLGLDTGGIVRAVLDLIGARRAGEETA